MNTMKMFVCVCVVMLVVLANPVFAQDKPGVGRIKAQLLGDIDPDRYLGIIQYDDGSRMIYGEAELNAELRLNRMVIDNTVLFEDFENPSPTMPRPNGAVKNFNFFLIAFEGNDSVLHGSFYDPFFEIGEGVNITLEIPYQERAIDVDLPAGINPRNVSIVSGSDGRGIGYYDEYRDEFVVFLDPDDGITEYYVVDMVTGDTLFVGEVGPTTGQTTDDGIILNTRYEDGIEKVDLTPWDMSSRRFVERTFDAVDTLDGVERNAKVFLLERSDTSTTWVHLNNFSGNIMAYQWRADLDMPAWQMFFETPHPDSGFEASLRIPSGPQKLVVVFYTDYSEWSFDATFAKWQAGGKG